MKSFQSSTIRFCAAIILFAALFAFSLSVGHAEVKPMTPSIQIPKREAISVTPGLKLCPNLNVSLTVSKTSTGLVTLNGTITNIGNKDYAMLSEAQIIMNLSYPPKTYAQVGVSDQLITKVFTQLKKGSALPVHYTYQIPNFQAWSAAAAAPNAKRLFTLRVVKKDMSIYQAGEECDPNNNSKAIEISYHEKLPG